MPNLYNTRQALIKDIKKEVDNSLLFTLELAGFSFNYGQYVMVSIPEAGECPISICSSALNINEFQLCIKKTGKVTEQIHKVKIGDKLQIRGPYGNGFPFHLNKNKNIILIAGGIGIAPLRSIILDLWFLKDCKVSVLYGSRHENVCMFKNEYNDWRKRCNFNIALQYEPKTKRFKRDCSVIGMITELMNKQTILSNSIAFVCGPLVMYEPVVKKLKKLDFKENDIYLSLERTMYCGIGLCEHCAIGDKYVCKDGPIFRYSDIKEDLFKFF
jgi:NAD(P)H-flavin reductase